MEEEHASTTPRSHVIKSGEGLYGISNTYGIGLDEILELNNLTKSDTIRVGQVIFIPSVTSEDIEVDSGRRMMHEVETGDTLYKISQLYEVELEKLMEWNGKKDHHLFIGEKLWIDPPVE